MNSQNELAIINSAINDGKGANIVQLPAREQSGGLFSHLIVATAANARHAAALGERIVKAIKQSGGKALVETSDEREWVLIDTGDIIIHIMQAEARGRYDLESLWRFEPATQKQQ